MNNYHPIEDFRFSRLPLRGNLGMNGVFILQASTDYHLAQFTFTKLFVGGRVEIEALDVRLVISSSITGKIRVLQNKQEKLISLNNKGWWIWKNETVYCRGRKLNQHQFNWYTVSTLGIPIVKTSSHLGDSPNKVFNFTILDSDLTRIEILTLVGIAFLQLSIPDSWLMRLVNLLEINWILHLE